MLEAGGDGRGAAGLDVFEVARVAQEMPVQRVAAVALLVVQLHLTVLKNRTLLSELFGTETVHKSTGFADNTPAVTYELKQSVLLQAEGHGKYRQPSHQLCNPTLSFILGLFCSTTPHTLKSDGNSLLGSSLRSQLPPGADMALIRPRCSPDAARVC